MEHSKGEFIGAAIGGAFRKPLPPHDRHQSELLAAYSCLGRGCFARIGLHLLLIAQELFQIERIILFHHATAFASWRATNERTRSHITLPRLSMYRSGWRMMTASVPISNPPSTIREASAMAMRIRVTSSSRWSSGAQINTASCTGAHTSISRSVARQHAKRSISAPLACIGKLRNDRGFEFS